VPGATWRKAECHLCLNCLNDCPPAASSSLVRVAVARGADRETPELKRRALVTSMAAGVTMLPLLRSGPV